MQWISWLLATKFRIYVFVFILMVLSSFLLYPAAQAGLLDWIWLLLGIFVFANLVVLWIK